MLNKISIQKVQDTPEVGSKKPTHNLVASNDKYENKTIIGKLWVKEGQYGKFLSGELSKARTYEGKEYDGYVILTQKEYDSLKGTPSSDDTGEVKDLSDIPF